MKTYMEQLLGWQLLEKKHNFPNDQVCLVYSWISNLLITNLERKGWPDGV